MQDYTKKGVQIPLPDGIEVIEDVVKYHDVSYDKIWPFGPNFTANCHLNSTFTL